MNVLDFFFRSSLSRQRHYLTCVFVFVLWAPQIAQRDDLTATNSFQWETERSVCRQHALHVTRSLEIPPPRKKHRSLECGLMQQCQKSSPIFTLRLCSDTRILHICIQQSSCYSCVMWKFKNKRWFIVFSFYIRQHFTLGFTFEGMFPCRGQSQC